MSDRTQSYAQGQAQARDAMTVVVNTIDHQRSKYEGILPSNIPWDVFRNAFLTAVQMNPRLLDADRQSLWLALQKAAGDGLKPDGRESALVIFGDETEDEDGNPVPSKAKGQKKVVYMPMIAGLVKLVRNTGQVSGIRAKLVYKGERVEIVDEDGRETYKHVRLLAENSEIDDSPANVVGAYAIVAYKDGSWEMEAMSRKQIDRVKAISRAKKGPWLPWYDEMAKKTVLRRLIKRLDRSAELRQLDAVIERDETMRTIEGDRPVENGQTAQIGQDHIRSEFTGQAATVGRQPERPQTPRAATTNGRADHPPADVQWKPEPTHGSAHNSGQEVGITQTDTLNGPATDGAVYLWAVNDIGEPTNDGEGMTPPDFAAWLVGALGKTIIPEALIEHNADAIADASADPVLRKMIQAAIDATRHVVVDRGIGGTGDQGHTSASHPLKVPVTRKGAPHWPHWPNYGKACKDAIAALETVEAVEAWAELNRPTYVKKSSEEFRIERHIRERIEALTPKQEEPPLSDAPPADEYDSPGDRP